MAGGKGKALRKNHFNLWATEMVAIFVHVWIAYVMWSGFPAKDLIANSYLFTVVPPWLWGIFSLLTGLAMFAGIYVFPFIVQQVASAVGMLLALALSLNGLAEMVRLFVEGSTPPLAVKLLFGLGLFYLAGHFAFSTEPPTNPDSPWSKV